jgi:hypothetical protein
LESLVIWRRAESAKTNRLKLVLSRKTDAGMGFLLSAALAFADIKLFPKDAEKQFHGG